MNGKHCCTCTCKITSTLGMAVKICFYTLGTEEDHDISLEHLSFKMSSMLNEAMWH